MEMILHRAHEEPVIQARRVGPDEAGGDLVPAQAASLVCRDEEELEMRRRLVQMDIGKGDRGVRPGALSDPPHDLAEDHLGDVGLALIQLGPW